MNIKTGDSNLVVRYLQTFLKENYNPSLFVSGTYDDETHHNLLDYLSLPNIAKINDVLDSVTEEFTTYNGNGDIVGGLKAYFISRKEYNTIIYLSKIINNEVLHFVNTNIENISDYVEKFGWELTGYTNPNQKELPRIEIRITRKDRKNWFPNRDMLYMVNAFDNNYYYDLAIRDKAGYDDHIHQAENYRISLIKCEPNQTFTIAHGYNKPTEIVIGSCPYNINNPRKDILPITNVLDRRDPPLNSGYSIVYTTSSDAKYLVIQTPYSNDLNFGKTLRRTILLGDVNLDDKVDEKDYELLYNYVNGKPGYVYTGAQAVAANITGDFDPAGNPIIDQEDVRYLREYLDGERPFLGRVQYTEFIDDTVSDINKLLVIYGDVSSNNENGEILNVPIESFITDPWMVHEKFLTFLLDRSISPYSRPDDISYAQNILEQVYSGRYHRLYTGYYDTYEDWKKRGYPENDCRNNMKDIIKEYQIKRGIYFAQGYYDINVDYYMNNDILGLGVDKYDNVK